MITFSAEGIKMPKIKKREVTAWIKAVAASYGRKVGEIGYLFVDDEKILEVNNEYLGHNYYLYVDRPEVDYTIYEHTKRPYGDSKKYYKKYSNRCVRRTKDVPNHNQYRKVFDLWWTID